MITHATLIPHTVNKTPWTRPLEARMLFDLMDTKVFTVVEMERDCRDNPKKVLLEFLDNVAPLVNFPQRVIENHVAKNYNDGDPYCLTYMNSKSHQEFIAFLGTDLSETTTQFCNEYGVTTNNDVIHVYDNRTATFSRTNFS